MFTKRILVIDDDPNFLEVVQACLEIFGGWKVVTAGSVYEGLIKAEAEQPNVILLDVMMPGLDGIDFLQRKQLNPAILCIPVIFITAIADYTEPELFLKLGVKAAISKPFDPYLLIPQIAQALDWNLEGF